MSVPRAARYRLHNSLLAMSATGTGCGSNDEDAANKASDASTAHPAPLSSGTAPSGVDEPPRTDLEHEKVVEWSHFEIVSERQLRFFFLTGDPNCYGSRAVVREDPSKVEVATLVGTLPNAPSHCERVGRMGSLLITVAQPVGERHVSHLDPSSAVSTES